MSRTDNSFFMSRLMKRCFCIVAAGWISSSVGVGAEASAPTRVAGIYSAEGNGIVGHGVRRYHNRPLYCNQGPAIVLGGDLPHIRFAQDPYVCGCLMLAVEREGKAQWIHGLSNVVFRYLDAHVTWSLSDPSLPGLTLSLDAVPMADAPGFCARLGVQGAQPGDRLIWAYGGATQKLPGAGGSGSLSASLDPTTTPSLTNRGFVAEDCRSNTVSIDDESFTVAPPPHDASAKTRRIVAGRCSTASALKVADAAAWRDSRLLAQGASKTDLPMVVGVAPLVNGEIFWAVESCEVAAEAVSGQGCPAPTKARLGEPATSFQSGMRRAQSVARQVVVDTPDARFNAAVAAVCAAIDGIIRPPHLMHGTMNWNMPYMGWRTMYGPTALGWHDIVKQAAAMYIATQEKADTKKAPRSDPELGHSAEAMDSRFYGLGRLQHGNQWRYDMQSLLYDMLIHAWRWTGDADLEKLLINSLDLHLRWMKDCFDPDDDGVYESYQNTAEVDQVWYNGGGTAEETAYAYTGHIAAMDLANKAGDSQAASHHRAGAEKIRNALMRSLWVAPRGHIGAYREQFGLRRLHEDSWLYSTFLPIDAGMLTDQESIQALFYTEWGLERVNMPLGGQRCWTSNWVPGTWSNRMLWPAHSYSLALAYCQAGLPDEAWELMKGGFLESGFNKIVPGGFDCEETGTDFHDTSSLFARAVVEGMFGYRPDYPGGIVRCVPSLPSGWSRASIRAPDFSLSFQRGPGADEYALTLESPAKVAFRVPLRAQKVGSVQVDGEPVAWETAPGYGHSIITVNLTKRNSARLIIQWDGELPEHDPISGEATVGNPLKLKVNQGQIVKVADPQQVLEQEKIASDAVEAAVRPSAGHHLVFGLVDIGQLRQWQIFKLKVSDPKAEATAEAQVLNSVPNDAKWTCVNLKDHLNGDVRTLYKQQYLSPRPPTCSVRLGSNGYHSWPFYFWGVKLPEINLSNVIKMLDAEGRLVTPPGVPFAWHGEERNIAFTSQWDNWPRSVTVPVGRKGKAVWLLVCGSTNPMQGRIANAQLRLNYSDGVADTIDLVPPFNFWSLCGQPDGTDYNYKRDAFALPKTPPATVQLGAHCRAILLNRRLRPDSTLATVTLEALSQEVVIGAMGITIME